MAFNAFDKVTLSADGASLKVDGHTDPQFVWTAIDVVVVSAADEDKRSEGRASLRSGQTPWDATVPQPAGAPFQDGEEVFTVGRARSDTDGDFLWAGKTTVAPAD